MSYAKLVAEELIGSAVHAADDVVAMDATRTAELLARGDVIHLGSLSVDVGEITSQGDASYCGLVSLSGTTAKEVDLNDLSTVVADYVGDTINFSAVHAICIQILGTGDLTLTVGNASATQFTGPLGAAAHTVAVRPGYPLVLATDATAGWTTSSKNLLKLLPSATMTVAITIRGTDGS